ncbi:MAG: hypothetical protein RLY76_508 [Actinomycetota bacterium]
MLKINSRKSTELALIEHEWQNTGITGSSISDSDFLPSYVEFCREASVNDRVFESFRSHPAYKAVLEHVPHHFAIHYAKSLRTSHNRSALIKVLSDIDRIGNPWKFKYRGIGVASPTALRYVYFADQISKMFDSSRNLVVCEVGCGFGGQMLALSAVLDIEKAIFVDLEPVLELTERFSCISNVPYKVTLLEPNLHFEDEFDLFLSNYAFSELTREYQDTYLERYVLKSKRGFMLWNVLSYEKLDGYSLDELVAKIPNAYIEVEKPLTFRGNFLIRW